MGPLQLQFCAVVLLLNVFALAVINRKKQSEAQQRSGPSKALPWLWRKNMYRLLIASSCAVAIYLDINYEVHHFVIPAKAYIMAFPLGLLDLYFSETHGVPMKVVLGASLWCSTIYVRNYFVTC